MTGYLTRTLPDLLLLKLLVSASSRLDYCNSLLSNIASKDNVKLQRVQIYLAQMVTRCCFSHSAIFNLLHWLPVKYQIMFKIPCFNIPYTPVKHTIAFTRYACLV